MARYAQHYNTKKTVQTKPIPGKKQVKNNAGGYVFKVSAWTQLERFLILGSEGGSYYVGERELTVDNAENVMACIKEDGKRTVDVITIFSDENRAPKNDPAIFALAMACAFGDIVTKTYAYQAITKVCRTGTHLFQFCEAVQKMRGWSRGLRRGVSKFYLNRTVDPAIHQILKYRQRDGWTHRDVLRLAHTGTKDPAMNAVLRYAVGKKLSEEQTKLLPAIVKGFEEVQAGKNVVRNIKKHELPWEAVPTTELKDKKVWEALLPHMPVMATLRNLGKMTSIGVLDSNLSDNTKLVVERLSDLTALKKARIHPLHMINALRVYQQGHGFKGDLAWKPVSKIVDMLDEMFYATFKIVEPSGKNMMLALDVSGSMASGAISNSCLTPRDGTAVLAMVTAAVEKNYEIVAFSNGIMNLDISPRMRLDGVLRKISGLPFQTTDCAQPMLHALKKKIKVDMFAIYTDSETYFGNIHPVQALKDYRQAMGIKAKLAVVGMTATEFTIADPTDAGSLDVVGFDSNVPAMLSEFARS